MKETKEIKKKNEKLEMMKQNVKKGSKMKKILEEMKTE